MCVKFLDECMPVRACAFAHACVNFFPQISLLEQFFPRFYYDFLVTFLDFICLS